MAVLRVIRGFCGSDHQADQNRRQRRQEARAEPDRFLGGREMLFVEAPVQQHAGCDARRDRDKGDQKN
jgi:hypothetical protein